MAVIAVTDAFHFMTGFDGIPGDNPNGAQAPTDGYHPGKPEAAPLPTIQRDEKVEAEMREKVVVGNALYTEARQQGLSSMGEALPRVLDDKQVR